MAREVGRKGLAPLLEVPRLDAASLADCRSFALARDHDHFCVLEFDTIARGRANVKSEGLLGSAEEIANHSVLSNVWRCVRRFHVLNIGRAVLYCQLVLANYFALVVIYFVACLAACRDCVR